MTFIKLDPNLMQGLIKNLESYADEAERARSNIHSSSVNNSHPVPEVDDATYLPAIFTVTSADAPTSRMMDTLNSMSINSNTGSNYNTTMGATINALGEVIDGLQERLQVIIDLNTDGISTTSSDGVPGYYLPDGTADTVENVKTYNTEAVATARADADALTQAAADGKADDGRTVDEVLASMATYQDSPAYGATFVTEVGDAQAYLDLVHDIDRAYNYPYQSEAAVSALGHVLGAASQTRGGDDLGMQFAAAIVESPVADNTAIFNALTSQSDVVYGSGFLTKASDVLLQLDPTQVHDGTSYLTTRYSHDPVAGVLAAMGNNPDAALRYLSGDGSVDGDGNWVPDDKARQRWEKLTSRDWDCDFTMPASDKPTAADGLTSAVAAASSFRNPGPGEDGAVSSDAAQRDAAATYTSGMGVDYFSGDSWSRDEFTDTMKHNLAVVVANSPEEVAAAAAGNAEVSTGGEGPSVARWGVTPTDMSTMIFRFGDSQDAMTVANTGVGDYHHRRIEEAMSTDDPDQSNLGDEYEQLSTSSSYLTELSRMRYDEDMKADSRHAEDLKKSRDTTVGTITSLVATIGSAGVGAFTDGVGAPLAYNSIVTVAKPAVTSAISGLVGQLSSSGTQVIDPSKASTQPVPNLLLAQAYGDAMNHGLLTDPSTLTTAKDHDWAVSDPDHPDAAPTVDIAGLTRGQADDMTAWKKNSVTNDNENDLRVLNEISHSINDGWGNGRDAASDARTN